MQYRRSGRSGLLLPAISLGLWHNFGHDRPLDTGRATLRRAFDLGITHFDHANNYGPPYGSAEENFGRILAADFAPFRDELIVSTKAGWNCGPALRRSRLAQVSCSRASTRASDGWVSTTWTCSTRTASTPRHRSRRRWAPSTPPSGRGRRSTSGSPPTRLRRRPRPTRSCASLEPRS